MIDLGTLDGKTKSYAVGINDSGQVVGTSSSSSHRDNDSRAFVTGANGVGMINLGAMDGDWSIANGINNLGQVIGAAGYGSYGSSVFAFRGRR